MDTPSEMAVTPPSADVHDQATIPPGQGVSAISPTGALPSFVMRAGLQLGDYELQDELGRGGMGVVFRARQKSLNRVVAIKLILAGQLASSQDIEQFHAEAEAAASLDHPGIVPIYEVGEHQGQHYFSMAFVDGENLATKVDRGPFDPTAAASCIRQVVEAVEYAHQKGIVHRDLKPGNILLDTQGRPRITDFGLAKRWKVADAPSSGKDVCGTVSYMPPEQAEAQHDRVGPASDVYALGATLYCLLTGRPPFQSANPIDTLLQVVQQPPVPPRQFNPVIPKDLETICLKCLEKDPARRYSTAKALSEDLQRFLNDQPILARPPSSWEQLRRWSRQHPGLALSGSLTAAAMLTLLLVSVLYNFLLQGEKLQARAATLEAQRLQQSTQQLLDQLSLLRKSERALDVLQFAEYGRLCVLMHRAEPQSGSESQILALEELGTEIHHLRDSSHPELQNALQRVTVLLQRPEERELNEWHHLTEQITQLCRNLWLNDSQSVPDLREQVRIVVVTRFLNTAHQLQEQRIEDTRSEVLRQLQEWAWGEIAIVGSEATRSAISEFLSDFQPERKPLTSSQLRTAIQELKAHCSAPDSETKPAAL